MCRRAKNNRVIGEEEFYNRYVRQAIPYEGFVKGKGYAWFRYDTIFPTTCNISGKMFWDMHTPVVVVQTIDTSDYMKESSLNVSIEDVQKLLVRTNFDGTMTVNMGLNKEVTLSKEHGKCQITIEDTGSEVNVRVAVADVRYENGVKNEIMHTQSCRLKDFHAVFEPVGSYFYSPGVMDMLERGSGIKKDVPEWNRGKTRDIIMGSLSTYITYRSGYFKYNELWHKTKTRGISTAFERSRWTNSGAKHWRKRQVEPFRQLRKIGTKLSIFGLLFYGFDIAMSGEVKVSHAINVGMIGLSFTGVGSIVATVWFVLDYGTMGVNGIIGNGAKGLGDMIDDWTTGGNPLIEFDPLIEINY